MSDDMNVFEYSVDLNNAEAPVPLPAGLYPFEVRQATVKTSSKGNKYIALNLHISPDAYPADFTDGSQDGTIVSFNRLVYDDSVQGRYRMKKARQALGAKLSNKVDVNELMGLTGTVQIEVETYEGEPRAQATKIVAN